LQKWRKAFAQHFQSSPLPTAGLDYYGDSHRHEATEFVQRIQGGPATVSCSLEQAESVVQAIDALYRSAKAGGQPVRLADAEATSPDLAGGRLARA
jgi:predicted dehydrogenase